LALSYSEIEKQYVNREIDRVVKAEGLRIKNVGLKGYEE